MLASKHTPNLIALTTCSLWLLAVALPCVVHAAVEPTHFEFVVPPPTSVKSGSPFPNNMVVRLLDSAGRQVNISGLPISMSCLPTPDAVPGGHAVSDTFGHAYFQDTIIYGVPGTVYNCLFQFETQQYTIARTEVPIALFPCPALQDYDPVSARCKCSKGYFLVTERGTSNSTCTPCPRGTYKDIVGDDQCRNCPPLRDTSPDASAATSLSQCLCKENYYLEASNGACQVCPVGALCGVGNQLSVAPGYWTADKKTFLRCPNQAACLGGDQNATCASGYTGPLCAGCMHGFGKDSALSCVACPPLVGSVFLWLLLLVLFVALISLLTWMSKVQGVAFDATKILIDYLQALALIGGFSVKWPVVRALLYDAFGLTLFRGAIPEVECLFSGYYDRYSIYSTMPFLLAVLATGIFGLLQFARRYRLANAKPGSAVEQGGLAISPLANGASVFVMSLFLMYPTVTSVAMDMENCTTYGTQTVMATDTSIDCTTSQHAQFKTIGAISGWTYALLIPVLIYFFANRRRNYLEAQMGIDRSQDKLERNTMVSVPLGDGRTVLVPTKSIRIATRAIATPVPQAVAFEPPAHTPSSTLAAAQKAAARFAEPESDDDDDDDDDGPKGTNAADRPRMQSTVRFANVQIKHIDDDEDFDDGSEAEVQEHQLGEYEDEEDDDEDVAPHAVGTPMRANRRIDLSSSTAASSYNYSTYLSPSTSISAGSPAPRTRSVYSVRSRRGAGGRSTLRQSVMIKNALDLDNAGATGPGAAQYDDDDVDLQPVGRTVRVKSIKMNMKTTSFAMPSKAQVEEAVEEEMFVESVDNELSFHLEQGPLAFLYAPYKSSRYGWEVVVFGRKLILVMCLAFLSDLPLAQCVSALWCWFLVTVFTSRVKPHENRMIWRLDMLSLYTCNFVMLTSALFADEIDLGPRYNSALNLLQVIIIIIVLLMGFLFTFMVVFAISPTVHERTRKWPIIRALIRGVDDEDELTIVEANNFVDAVSRRKSRAIQHAVDDLHTSISTRYSRTISSAARAPYSKNTLGNRVAHERGRTMFNDLSDRSSTNESLERPLIDP